MVKFDTPSFLCYIVLSWRNFFSILIVICFEKLFIAIFMTKTPQNSFTTSVLRGFCPFFQQNYYVFLYLDSFFTNGIKDFFIILKSHDVFYISFFVYKKKWINYVYIPDYKKVFYSVIFSYIEFRIFTSILICLLNIPYVISAFKSKKDFPSGTSLYALKAAAKALFS